MRRRRRLEQGVAARHAHRDHRRDRWLGNLLRLLGLTAWGYRQYLDLRLVDNRLPVRGLADAFAGLRLLQISDLHTDLDAALMPRLLTLLDGPAAAHDAVVLTGDFRQWLATEPATVVAQLRPLRARCHGPVFAVLGNHDNLDLTPALESLDITVLHNDAVHLELDGARLALAGVDDPYFFHSHDLPRAAAAAEASVVPTILLAHAPHVAPEAARLGFAAQLSGHTHGGQFCLPGGFPLIRHRGIRYRWVAGPWREGALHGYTSRGTGASGLPFRCWCPPEVTVHNLLPTRRS